MVENLITDMQNHYQMYDHNYMRNYYPEHTLEFLFPVVNAAWWFCDEAHVVERMFEFRQSPLANFESFQTAEDWEEDREIFAIFKQYSEDVVMEFLQMLSMMWCIEKWFNNAN